MDSSKIINVDTSAQNPSQPGSTVDFADVNLDAIRAESLATIEQLQSMFDEEFRIDIGEIQDLLSKSFRHFLLDKEQERMPFLQRVMTSHIENMEDERGFPPRHPVHWFKSRLEFSSTGILQFDFKKDAELFIESALNHIETEIKDQLLARQQATIGIVDRTTIALRQEISDQIQSLARARKVISSEYVNSFIQTERLIIKVIDRFYFVSMGERFNPKQELIYSEVCVRPTGMFDRSKDSDKPTQLKYAISCDRLLDVVNESIARSIGQIQQQTQAYLNDELTPQIDKLFQDLAV
ncbi:hypothetical protein [Chamaesiphon sp. OTE_75_metabat_556]|jgi:hypothetical protein|uniref:hypothetical protein n=1 Tax=Chamaesiphon sp. OTE_75_metabat_556 TaxID=2964692 RepID=UPI00286BFE1A|nr:hypothetical protein [Chamaesiphon sp. OTE_75_metabat_556]